MDELISIGEAARRLGGLSVHTISAWLSRGRLPRTKVGARTMIRESDLRASISACNPEPPARSKSRRGNGSEQ
jgi:excisionase family DNA binding protein